MASGTRYLSKHWVSDQTGYTTREALLDISISNHIRSENAGTRITAVMDNAMMVMWCVCVDFELQHVT